MQHLDHFINQFGDLRFAHDLLVAPFGQDSVGCYENSLSVGELHVARGIRFVRGNPVGQVFIQYIVFVSRRLDINRLMCYGRTSW